LSVSKPTPSKNTLEKRNDPAFCIKGFNNWKNATVCFSRNQASKAHYHGVIINVQEKTPIHTQISSALAKHQKEAQYCLEKGEHYEKVLRVIG